MARPGMSCLTPTRQDGHVGTHFDLAVIGTGSGNGIADDSFADWEVAIIEEGVFGGTCLNRGCIPTKMLVYPADLALGARHGPDLGVHTSFTSADWPAIRDRIFTRIDPISEGGRHWRAEGRSNVRLYEGHARFVDERTLDTGTGETITADHVVVATGSRPVIPDVPGLDDVDFHTSDTIMRIDALPERLLILGGGVISAEFAHVFSAFGSQVTVINRSELLLGQQDHEIAGHFTEQARRRWDLRLGRTVDRIEPWNEGLRAHLDDGTTVEADTLLVATCAAELPGSGDFYRAAAARGIRLNAGHSNASWDEMAAAYDAGVRHVDHFFCAMSNYVSVRSRFGTPMRGGMEEFVLATEDMTTEVIADGRHLAPELLRFVLKMKGVDKVALVTDCNRALDMLEGEYLFGPADGGEPFYNDGSVGLTTDRQSLASSIRGMDFMVGHMHRVVGVDVPTAVRMGSQTPAKILGLDKEVGSLEAGKRADVLLLDEGLNVREVWIGGEQAKACTTN